MAEFLPPVILEIQAKAGEAIASMQKVNGELDKMEAKALKAGGSLDAMTRTSKYAGVALLGLGGAFGIMAVAGVKAALSVQQAQANLKTAITDTGVSFAAAKPFIDQQAEAMLNLGFSTEDTYTALAQMTAATRSPETALKSLGVAADLAAFKHESLAAASDTVARAAMGQARGLADLGLAINKTIPKGASLQQIMALIEQRTAGAAKRAADANPWVVLQAKFKALEEELGTALLPTFIKLTNWIIKDGLPGLKSLGNWISNNKGLFITLAGTLAALWVAPKVANLINAIKVIKDAFIALRAVLVGVDIAEALATGGGSVVAGMAAIAAAGVAYEGFHLLSSTDKNKPAPSGPQLDINKNAQQAAALGSGSLAQSLGLVTPPSARVTQNPASIQSQSLLGANMDALAGPGIQLIQTTKKTKTKNTAYNKAAKTGSMSSGGNTIVNFNGTVNDPSTLQKAVISAVKNGSR